MIKKVNKFKDILQIQPRYIYMSYSLYLCVDLPGSNPDAERILKEKYRDAISNFNANSNDQHRDSGFDIFIPSNITHSSKDKQITVNHGIKAVCCKELISTEYPSGYYMYPRSSISKSRYRMANSIGIIDSGYRGNLIAKLDVLPVQPSNLIISQHTRMFQICAPDLSPFRSVKLMHKSNPIFCGVTTRGSGGFGSTST